MPRQKRSIHYVYRTTNLLNNRYYIGKHSTYSLEDGYLGSGKRLRYEIDKYGRENFKKEILEFCETSELALEREKQLVNEELLKDPLCLNFKNGGEGGWDHINGDVDFRKEKNSRAAKKMNEVINSDPEFCERRRIRMLDPEYKKKLGEAISNAHKIKVENGTFVPSFLGKTHSEEAKRRIGDAAKLRGGEKSSMHDKHHSKESRKKISDSIKGRCCINNGINTKYVKRAELDSYISSGWKLGGRKRV